MIVRREFELYGPQLGEELRLRLRKDWERYAVGNSVADVDVMCDAEWPMSVFFRRPHPRAA